MPPAGLVKKRLMLAISDFMSWLRCYAIEKGSAIMKVLCKCGGFYLTEGMACPVCGHELTPMDCLKHMAAQTEHRKTARKKSWERCCFYESKEAEAAAMSEYRQKKREEKFEDQWPVSAVLISTEYGQNALKVATRGLIGSAIAGFAGAFTGVSSVPSKPKKATFSVKYASGRTGTETVDVGSMRYRQLVSVLDDYLR